MTAETVYRMISIAFLVLGLLAFIRASRILAEADAKRLEAKHNRERIEDLTGTVPEGYHWVNSYSDGIRVIAEHGIENTVVKRIPYREGDIEDYRFAVREAEELIEILKRKTI